MGKKTNTRKTKNVFQVPTARSIKLKAKAEKMVKNLKKVSLQSNNIEILICEF